MVVAASELLNWITRLSQTVRFQLMDFVSKLDNAKQSKPYLFTLRAVIWRFQFENRYIKRKWWFRSILINIKSIWFIKNVSCLALS